MPGPQAPNLSRALCMWQLCRRKRVQARGAACRSARCRCRRPSSSASWQLLRPLCTARARSPPSPAGDVVNGGHLLLKQLPGDLNHEARPIARVIISRAGAAVLHAAQRAQGLRQRRSGVMAALHGGNSYHCVAACGDWHGWRPLTCSTIVWLFTLRRLAMKPT